MCRPGRAVKQSIRKRLTPNLALSLSKGAHWLRKYDSSFDRLRMRLRAVSDPIELAVTPAKAGVQYE